MADDRAIVERQFQGVRSPLAAPPLLTPLEASLAAFADYYRPRVIEALRRSKRGA